MFLRELFEAPTKTAAFALGRLNPATTGHELLVNAIKQAPGDSFLFLTDRAPKLPDNPLTAEEKLDWARKSFDGISIGLARTVLTAADRLYKMGYREVTFLEGEDKLYNLIKQYNGVEKEMHNYNFDKINYVQLQRNAEAADATGMSGTKLRGYVTSNDLEGFKKGVTTSAQPYAEDMFKKLQGIMGVDAVEESEQDVSKAWKTYKQLKDFENQMAASKSTSNFTMSIGNSSKNLARDIANLEKQYPQFAEKYAKEIALYKKGAPQRLARMQTSLDNFKDD